MDWSSFTRSHCSDWVIISHCHLRRNKTHSVHYLCTFLCTIILKSVWALPAFIDVVYSLSHVRFFVTPWTAAHQAFLSFTISWNLLKLMSIESVMPSNHIIFCHPTPSPLALNLSQHWGPFQWIGSLNQVAKVLELQLQHQSHSEYSGLIFFRVDWFDLLAIQGTLKSLLQHRSSKVSVLKHLAFFVIQL